MEKAKVAQMESSTALKILKVVDTAMTVGKHALHYGFIPLIIGLGYYNTPAPQRPGLHKVFLPF